MLFKKSKKKQLAEIKYELYLLREGLETQKEHALRLIDHHGIQGEPSEVIGKLYNYFIEKIKKIEDIT